uniref:Uncharacterized protein n=1 Tax=Anguilla anguilla TaxID=7936 RepID=A0A0E9TEJ9_ANGAN
MTQLSIAVCIDIIKLSNRCT